SQITMNSFEIGRDLTSITMGIDAFERRQPADRSLLGGEGLVPIYLGKDSIAPRDYNDVETMKADLDKLASEASALPAGPRKVFLKGMIRPERTATKRLAGASPSFEEKVTQLVGAPAGREDEAVIEDARSKLDAVLKRSGFVNGTLAERVADWEEARA